jgi:hypothetical protein
MMFLTNACAECQAIPSETVNPVHVQQFGPLRERLRVSDVALIVALWRMRPGKTVATNRIAAAHPLASRG